MVCLFIYLFIYYLFLAVLDPCLRVRAPSSRGKRGPPPSGCAGLPPPRPLPPRSTGSSRAGPAIVAHRPSRSKARGIPPDQGSNPRSPHWQADSQPLRHQGSPGFSFYVPSQINFLTSLLEYNCFTMVC